MTTTAKPDAKLFPDSVERRDMVKRAFLKTRQRPELISSEALIALGKYLETGQYTKLTAEQQHLRRKVIKRRSS